MGPTGCHPIAEGLFAKETGQAEWSSPPGQAGAALRTQLVGMNPKDVRKFISAFADGELDVEQNLRVLEQLAMDPQTTKRVLHQQQLCKAVGRAISEPRSMAPGALKAKMMELAETLPPPGVTVKPTHSGVPTDSAPVMAVIGRWVPSAVAAILFVSSMVALVSVSFRSDGGGAAIRPPQMVPDFGRRHVTRSRMIEDLLADPSLPRDLYELPSVLTQRFQ